MSHIDYDPDNVDGGDDDGFYDDGGDLDGGYASGILLSYFYFPKIEVSKI